MKKEFIYNIVFLIAVNLLVKAPYILGLEPAVQNKIANYGLYFSMYSFVFLFQFINDPGLQSYNSIYISNNKADINHYFPRILGLKAILFCILSSCVFIAALALKYDTSDFGILAGIVLIFFLGSLYFMLRTSLSAVEHYRIDTWLSSLDRLFIIIILGYFLIIKYPLTLSIFVWVQVFCYTVCVFIALFFLRKIGIKIAPIMDFDFIKFHLKASLPYALIILLTSVVSRVDGVMLERMMDDGVKIAGEYATGFRFIEASNMFGLLFGGLLLPMFSNKIVEGESIQEVFSIAYRLVLLISLVIGFSFYFYASDIFDLLYKKELTNNLPAIKILLLTVIPILISNAFGPIILATKKIKAYNIAFAIAAPAIILLNYFLIPSYGILASASIALFIWTVILIIMIWISIETRQIEFFESDLFLKSLLIVFLSFSCYKVFDYISMNWILEIVICPILIFILSLIGGFITLKDLLKSKV